MAQKLKLMGREKRNFKKSDNKGKEQTGKKNNGRECRLVQKKENKNSDGKQNRKETK